MLIKSFDEPKQSALVGVCVFAALADGAKSESERGEMQRIAGMLDLESAAPTIQHVLLGKLSLDAIAAALTSHDERVMAYELALGVCEVDGSITPDERRFLDQLRSTLVLDVKESEVIEADVSAIALANPSSASFQSSDSPSAVDNRKTILTYSILNGALELLPESLATIAILPLQMKMVYGIGKSHGFDLDSGHIKELIATLGMGMSSQIIEGFFRKFAQKTMRKIAGKTGGRIANRAAGSAMSFGSTYAIGMIADRYYASNRSLSTLDLRNGFEKLKEQAGDLYSQNRGLIEDKAKTLNAASIMELLNPGKIPVT